MRTPEQVADALKQIYDTQFGGKDRGRFQISRQGLRELSERKRLEDSTKDAIVGAAYDRDLVVTDMGDDFSVIEVDVMRNYRKVPQRLISVHNE